MCLLVLECRRALVSQDAQIFFVLGCLAADKSREGRAEQIVRKLCAKILPQKASRPQAFYQDLKYAIVARKRDARDATE